MDAGGGGACIHTPIHSYTHPLIHPSIHTQDQDKDRLIHELGAFVWVRLWSRTQSCTSAFPFRYVTLKSCPDHSSVFSGLLYLTLLFLSMWARQVTTTLACEFVLVTCQHFVFVHAVPADPICCTYTLIIVSCGSNERVMMFTTAKRH
jgi:hypothetical protein